MRRGWEATVCGRYTLKTPGDRVARMVGLPGEVRLEPRYNIAPSQRVSAVRLSADSVEREVALLQWGLIPSWMKEAPTTATMINARIETITEKPSFRNAYRRRRCLIPASGFFEWKGEKAPKQPYYIYLKDTPVFTFAGIWEHWQGPDGSEVETAALLTSEAAPSIRETHDRMPVIVREAHHDAWLRADISAEDVLDKKIVFSYYPISRAVNNIQNDGPQLIEERPLENPELPV